MKVKRCRDGNVCEAYVIPFLFGSFFTVCHPYIDVHFLKCFFCDFNIMYMYVLAAVVSFVPCYKFFGSTFLFNLPGFCTYTFVETMHVMFFWGVWQISHCIVTMLTVSV